MIQPKRHTPLLEGTIRNLVHPPRSYTYFARARECPFAGGDWVTKAAWAADASMLSYARFGQDLMTGAQLAAEAGRGGFGTTLISARPNDADWNQHGTQVLILSNQSLAIIAFRGTEPDDPLDIAWDAMIEPVLEAGGLVHRGFQFALDTVWPKVRQWIAAYRQANPEAEICLTGHSLGGALALLAFGRAAGARTSLYTFGCPRVGNEDFRQHALAQPHRDIRRVVNLNDAVAHVPLDSLLYRQTPQLCERFLADGGLVTDDGGVLNDAESLIAALLSLRAGVPGFLLDTPAPASVVDHSPARYCFRLWDCV